MKPSKALILLFLPIFFLILSSCESETLVEKAVINFVIGNVSVNGEKALIGHTVSSGDVVLTGPLSSCDIQIGDSMIRIKENSKLELSSALILNGSEKTDLSLVRGKLLCKPKKLLQSEQFIVRTKTSVAAVRGTQFSVLTDAKDTTKIKVFEGNVSVARRIPSLDNKTESLLAKGSSIGAKQSAIITLKDQEKAEASYNKALNEGKSEDEALSATTLAVPAKQIETFDPEDFKGDAEIIKVKPTPTPTPKPKPKPAQKLLYSRYEAYIVVNGKVKWKGELKDPAVKHKGKVYVAAKSRVIAATKSGHIIWQKKIKNSGTLSKSGTKLLIETPSGKTYLSMTKGTIIK